MVSLSRLALLVSVFLVVSTDAKVRQNRQQAAGGAGQHAAAKSSTRASAGGFLPTPLLVIPNVEKHALGMTGGWETRTMTVGVFGGQIVISWPSPNFIGGPTQKSITMSVVAGQPPTGVCGGAVAPRDAATSATSNCFKVSKSNKLKTLQIKGVQMAAFKAAIDWSYNVINDGFATSADYIAFWANAPADAPPGFIAAQAWAQVKASGWPSLAAWSAAVPDALAAGGRTHGAIIAELMSANPAPAGNDLKKLCLNMAFAIRVFWDEQVIAVVGVKSLLAANGLVAGDARLGALIKAYDAVYPGANPTKTANQGFLSGLLGTPALAPPRAAVCPLVIAGVITTGGPYEVNIKSTDRVAAATACATLATPLTQATLADITNQATKLVRMNNAATNYVPTDVTFAMSNACN